MICPVLELNLDPLARVKKYIRSEIEGWAVSQLLRRIRTARANYWHLQR